MDRLVIEIKNRSLHIRDHKLFEKYPIKIGRSYENDLVIPDPYVCLDHLQIKKTESNEWDVVDLDSKNGIYLNSKKTKEKYLRIKSGDKIRIGHTLLKFVSPDQPMAETIIIKKGILNPEGGFLLASAWLSFIVCLLFLLIEEFAGTYSKVLFSKLISESIAPAFIPLIWATVWSAIGRISKHHAYFHEQLLISSIGFLVMLSIQTTSEYIEYLSSSTAFATISRYIFEAILFLTLLHENFRIATQFKGKVLKVYAIIVTTIIMGLSTIEILASKADFNDKPSYSQILKPPFFKIIPSTSKEKFFEECTDL